MHILELEYFIERELRESIQQHFPLDWKEDSITHDLAIRFRNRFRRMTLHGTRFPMEVEWEIYKLHGRRESTYGDIGLLFRSKLPAGSVIDGAGFIEAKLRARNSTKFAQVRHEQVTRILSRSPQTRLLLYDYNAVSVLDSSSDVDPNSTISWRGSRADGEPLSRHSWAGAAVAACGRRQSLRRHTLSFLPLAFASVFAPLFPHARSRFFRRRHQDSSELSGRAGRLQHSYGCPNSSAGAGVARAVFTQRQLAL